MKQKWKIIKEGKVARLRLAVFNHAIQIGSRTLMYADLSARVFNSFIAIELTQNQLVAPAIRATRIAKTRAQKIEALNSTVQKLAQLRKQIMIQQISKEECKSMLEKLIPHGFKIQNEAHAVRWIETDIKNLRMTVNGVSMVGGIDTGTTITIIRKMPIDAQKVRTIMVNTVNGIKEKAVYRIEAIMNSQKQQLEAIQGEIPCDFYLSPADARKFGIVINAKAAVEVGSE